MDDDNRLGTFLRETRNTLGLTQLQVAEKTGVSQSSLSSLERGNYDAFSFAQASALSRFYHIPCETFDALLRGEEVAHTQSSLDALLETLDEAQRTFVHGVVVTLVKGLRA